MKFKHEQFALDWLAGRHIQYLEEGIWRDLPHMSEAHRMPSLYVDKEYRMKPMTVRYRVGLLGDTPVAAYTIREETVLSASPNFCRWITDWQEVAA